MTGLKLLPVRVVVMFVGVVMPGLVRMIVRRLDPAHLLGETRQGNSIDAGVAVHL